MTRKAIGGHRRRLSPKCEPKDHELRRWRRRRRWCMSNDTVSNVAQGMLGMCVLGLLAFLFTHRATPSPPAPSAAISIVKNWRTYAQDGNRIGPKAAPATIIEFADFQCPFCRRMAIDLEDIRRRYPKSVAILVRQFPLARLHPYAVAAAEAAECAADQSRFKAFYDRVYGMQDSIGTTSWMRFASLSGVPDTVRFKRCLDSREPQARVKADIDAGLRLGVSGTPTLLVDSVQIDGNVSEQILDSLLRSALRTSGEP